MYQIENTNSYKNWQQYTCERGKTPITWKDQYKNFNWQETFMIDEIPTSDVWNTYATTAKYEFENFLRSKKIPKECTRHYMALNPKLDNEFLSVLDFYKNRKHHYNFLKITPACSLVWHCDTYATFVKHNNISAEHSSNISRTIVMLEDWSIGQTIQIGNSFLHKWSKGDTYTWKGDQWHGAANFGYEDLVIMQITWL